jgi:membrane-bound lytic murein transglycosylase MltF
MPRAGPWRLLLLALLAAGAAHAQTALPPRFDPWTGDFDGMQERRALRVLVPYSRTLYFNDKGAQRGLVADSLKDFEVFLNRKFRLRNRPFTVVVLPTTRADLLTGLLDGEGDIAVGNLTVTAARAQRVDFSVPEKRGVAEIVVTGPASPALATLDDLAGKEVHVRRSASYHDSLVRLNQRFRALGKPAVKLALVPEALEDEDLMDMVAAGLLGLVVVDDWKAALWADTLTQLKPRPDLALAAGGDIAWAFRKGSPKLAAVVNEFIRTHPGVHAARFREHASLLKRTANATAEADWQRFESTIALFRKYGPVYRFDSLMVTALGYQESRLDQSARSEAGAIGIMQLMPATGRSLKVGDITQVEPNVHGGFKYLRQLHDRHLAGTELDEENRTLFAIAAYNAGPSRIASLRAEAERIGLDPNLWFNHVELVAARRIGQETVGYVRNVYKYYVAYRLQLETLEARRAAATRVAPPR